MCGDDAFIKTGATATDAGEYKLVVNFLGNDFTIRKTFEIGDDLNFPSAGLNEYYVFRGRIYKPDGTALVITVGEGEDAIDYDCIYFETIMNYEVPNPGS
jgi:hypothetical protein